MDGFTQIGRLKVEKPMMLESHIVGVMHGVSTLGFGGRKCDFDAHKAYFTMCPCDMKPSPTTESSKHSAFGEVASLV
jgi:hypothetical protein